MKEVKYVKGLNSFEEDEKFTGPKKTYAIVAKLICCNE